MTDTPSSSPIGIPWHQGIRGGTDVVECAHCHAPVATMQQRGPLLTISINCQCGQAQVILLDMERGRE